MQLTQNLGYPDKTSVVTLSSLLIAYLLISNMTKSVTERFPAREHARKVVAELLKDSTADGQVS
jgi:hypothetical protein